MCNTVIDNPGRLDKPRLVKEILSFLETDTVLFYGEEPPELLQAQIQKWSPIILWFRDRFGVTIEPTTDVMAAPVTQCVYPRLDVTCADVLMMTCCSGPADAGEVPAVPELRGAAGILLLC